MDETTSFDSREDYIQIEDYVESNRKLKRDSKKQNLKLSIVKNALHRQSGFLNKLKDTQRSRKQLAKGNPCE